MGQARITLREISRVILTAHETTMTNLQVEAKSKRKKRMNRSKSRGKTKERARGHKKSKNPIKFKRRMNRKI